MVSVANLFKPTVVRYLDKSGKAVPKGTIGAKKSRQKSAKWYGQFVDHLGIRQRVPLCENKTAAGAMLSELVRKAEMAKAGLTSPFEEHARKLLSQHIDDFETVLRSKGNTEKQVLLKIGRIRRLLLEWCQFQRLADLDAVRVQREAADRVEGDQTRAYYIREVRSFARWLCRTQRVGFDPFASLSSPEVKTLRQARRPFSETELRLLLDVAGNSEEVFRGLTGRDRRMLYLTAISTGLRAEELSCLCPENFRLADETPTVFLSGEETKNGKPANQPIPSSIANALAAYLEGKEPDKPVWAGTWYKVAAKMLRVDLKAAGIAETTEGPEGTLHLQFHSIRHTLIYLLDQAGVSLKQAMVLARHSDPKLTAARYGRAQLNDLGESVERLPDLISDSSSPQAFRATGTDNFVAPPVALVGDIQSDLVRADDNLSTEKGDSLLLPQVQETPGNPANFQGFCLVPATSGGWDRTTDTRLMKPLL
jgi:integrase